MPPTRPPIRSGSRPPSSAAERRAAEEDLPPWEADLPEGLRPKAEALAEGLLEEAGVAVVPGDSFGAPGFIRLSYALSDSDLERGVTRMLDMFGRL